MSGASILSIPFAFSKPRSAGDLYSRTVVTYWRPIRKKGVFLSQYGMERIHIAPDLHAHSSDAIVGNF